MWHRLTNRWKQNVQQWCHFQRFSSDARIGIECFCHGYLDGIRFFFLFVCSFVGWLVKCKLELHTICIGNRNTFTRNESQCERKRARDRECDDSQEKRKLSTNPPSIPAWIWAIVAFIVIQKCLHSTCLSPAPLCLRVSFFRLWLLSLLLFGCFRSLEKRSSQI